MEKSDPVQTPPSAFIARAEPQLSIFRDSWYEAGAWAYLHILVALGDKWRPDLTLNELRAGLALIPSDHASGVDGRALNDERVASRVLAKLRSADDARAFCMQWSNVGIP